MDLCRKMVEINKEKKCLKLTSPECYTDLRMAEKYHKLYLQTKNAIE